MCGVEFPQEMIFSDVKKQFMERKLSLKKTCHILEEREMDEEKMKPNFRMNARKEVFLGIR